MPLASSLGFVFGQHGRAFVWTQTVGGAQNWTTGANWAGGVAPVLNAFDIVDLSQANITSNVTLTLGADRKAENWKFGDVVSIAATWTIANSNKIVLSGVDPYIQVNNTTTTINCPVESALIWTKKGAGTLVLAGTNVLTADRFYVEGGALTFNTLAAWGGLGKSIHARQTSTINCLVIGYTAESIYVHPGAALTIVSTGALVSTLATLTAVRTHGPGSVVFVSTGMSNAHHFLDLGDASALTGNIKVRLAGNVNYSNHALHKAMQFSALADAAGSAIQFEGGQSDGNQALAVAYLGTAALTFNNRRIEMLPRVASSWSARDNIIRNESVDQSHIWVINTDLYCSILAAEGSRNFGLGGVNTGNNSFNGLIANGVLGHVVGVCKIGAGKWILGNAANSFTGAVRIDAGTLQVDTIADGGVPCHLGAATNAAANLVLAGGTLRYDGTGDTTDRRFTLNASSTIASVGSGPLVFSNTSAIGSNAANKTLTLTGTNTDANTIAGSFFVITAALSLIKSGTSRWVLTNGANSSLSGTVTINNGILEVTHTTAIGTATFITTGAGILRVTGLTTLQLGGLTGAVNLVTKIEAAGYAPLTILTLNVISGKVLTYSGGIHDGDAPLKVIKTGAGNQEFTGNSSFSGGVEINQGILQYSSSSNANAFGAASNTITFAGNSDLHNANSSFTMAQNIHVNSGVIARLTGAFGETTIVNGAVTCTDQTSELRHITFSDGFNLYFTSTANTFNGIFHVAATNDQYGNVAVNSFGDGGQLRVGVGAATSYFTFGYGAGPAAPLVWNTRVVSLRGTTGGLVLANNSGNAAYTVTISTNLEVFNGNKTLEFAGTNTGANTFSGILANPGTGVLRVRKSGAGLWALAGANTYTGSTTITAGTMRFDTAGSLGTGALLISGTGKAGLNYIGTQTVASLTLGGVAQAAGTYGATGSGAANINDTYFTGAGTVTV